MMTRTLDARRAPTGLRSRPPRNGASREELLRRRVLPLAAFAAEVARGSGQAAKPPVAERLRLYGSTIVPIAVPLAPGESEQAYEAKFEEWLAQRHVSLKEMMAAPDPNRERTTRCSYAVHLARAFLAAPKAVCAPQRGDEDELEEGEEVEEKQDQAAREPIDMRLLPREVLNARKFVTLAEYQDDYKAGKFALMGFLSTAEKQRIYGAPVAPILVPLAPGETPGQYEDRFVAWLQKEKHLTLEAVQDHKVPMLERYMRLEFASLNGKGIERFVAPLKRTVPSVTSQSSAKKAKTDKMEKVEEAKKQGIPEQVAKPAPPPLTNASCKGEQVVRQGEQEDESTTPLDRERLRVSTTEVVSLPNDHPKAELGQLAATRASVAPISVPIAPPSETPEQYEARFLTWLVRERHMTLGTLRDHRVATLERSLRDEFASLNSKAPQKLVAPHTPPLKQTLPATYSPSKKGEVRTDVQPTQEAKTPSICGVELTDLARQCSLYKEEEGPDSPEEDMIVNQLQLAYNDLNDNILLNEKALAVEEVRLATQCDGITFHERIQLQRENEEMRELIEGEFPARTAAAAMLIAYAWRDNTAALARMLDDPTASDLPHVQQRIHERMSQLAEETVTPRHDSKKRLTGARDRPDEEHEDSVRRQLALLVHFDEKVRRGVQSVLAAAAVITPSSDPEAPAA